MCEIAIKATLIPEQERLNALPRFFGPKHMMLVENLVFAWMKNLVPSYGGGYWNFYELSNGGFYMSPDCKDEVQLICENGFDGNLSTDAAGIVACTYALNELANNIDDNELFIDMYFKLKAFISGHKEIEKIYRAID